MVKLPGDSPILSPITSQYQINPRKDKGANDTSEDENIYVTQEELDSQISFGNTTNPFLDPVNAEYYKSVYENCKYECRERFDPFFTWNAKEEKKLVWKLDFRVTLLACFMFVALQVDRGNLGQAVSDNLLDDLNLTTDEYNWGNTIFYITFIVAEIPSQLISKKVGADNWVPIQIVCWSIVTILQCKLVNKSGFYATRALLGLLEGGFIPDLVLWMSYFYTSSELSMRLSYFWTALSLTQIGSSLLAFAILRMRGALNMAGWQWLFLIEGLFTLLIGIISGFLMVPSVVETKKPWNKKGWFTEHEEKIIVNKILRDDPTKGDMNNRQGLTPMMLIKGILDYNLWPVYIIGIMAYVPLNLLTSYMTLVLKSLGFTTLQVNLLTIPYSVIHIITLLGITWLSEKVNDRSLICLLLPLWSIPLIGILAFWEGSMTNKWGTWVICTLILGLPYIHAICVSWVSRNSSSIKTRSVSTSLYNICAQLGSIISSNIYHESDKPLYRKGNATLFGFAIAMVPILLLTKAYYVWVNKKRDKLWSKMDVSEREDYILNTSDEGSHRLDFRFSH